jgi:hypothetical protein
MKTLLLIALIVSSSGSAAFAQAARGGFAPPNAYGNPGSYYGGPGYARNFGYNTPQPGYVAPGGFYTNPYGGIGTTPVYGIPTPIGGGMYNVNSMGSTYQMWRSPNGFYYPWLGGGSYYGAPVVYGQTATQAPTQQTPPISTVIGDMLTYLDQQKDKGRLDAPDYQHLRRRASDLQSKYANLRTAGEGSIDPQDEKQIRLDIDSLGSEVVRAVH